MTATSHAETTEALRHSELRKGAILASALDAIITMDHEGRIDEFNPAAEQIFGYRAADVLGRRLADVIIPPEMREAHSNGLARHLATGGGPLLRRRSEMVAMRSDGSLFPAEISITRVDMPGPPLFTGIVRDISDRMAAEAERRSLEARLREAQRLESIGELAGKVAHDFNNLLGVILNYVGFVATAVADDPQAKHDVDQILAATQQAVHLTRQLVTFARSEEARHEMLDLHAAEGEIPTSDGTTTGSEPLLDAAPGHGEIVLVVEDQDAVRDVTARILRFNGYTVYEASNGADAIAVHSEHDIDLLLTDVVMPQMTGPELVVLLRDLEPTLPVLYMSGYADGVFGPDGPDGDVPLLQKPFDESAILHRVHDTIAAGQVTRRTSVADQRL